MTDSLKRRYQYWTAGYFLIVFLFDIPVFILCIIVGTAVPRGTLSQRQLSVPLESVPEDWRNVFITKGHPYEWRYPRAEESPLLFQTLILLMIISIGCTFWIMHKRRIARDRLPRVVSS